MALHHKLCHTLGGSFDLPHAETHAVILPHAIAFNEGAAADLLANDIAHVQLLPAGEFAAADGRPGPGRTWRLSDEQGRALADAIGADRVGFRISPGNPYNGMDPADPAAQLAPAGFHGRPVRTWPRSHSSRQNRAAKKRTRLTPPGRNRR